MSVTVRPYRQDKWQVDVRTRMPDDSVYRERRVLTLSKSAAQRWGQDRERHLLQHGLPKPKKEVPTLAEFWPRFLEGHARANRQKPSGIAAKEMIGRLYLVPQIGDRRLDAITAECVQRIKATLTGRAPRP